MEAKRIIEIFKGWVKRESILSFRKINPMYLDKKPCILVTLDIREEDETGPVNTCYSLGPYQSEDDRDMVFNELIEWVSQ